MLSMQLNDAKRRKAEKRKEVEAMRTRATKASAVLTNALWREVNDGGLQVYKSEKLVEKELKLVESELRRFQQQNKQWLTLISGLAEELKKLGDVTNWLEHTEAQLVQVAGHIDAVLYDKGGPSSEDDA